MKWMKKILLISLKFGGEHFTGIKWAIHNLWSFFEWSMGVTSDAVKGAILRIQKYALYSKYKVTTNGKVYDWVIFTLTDFLMEEYGFEIIQPLVSLFLNQNRNILTQ